MFDLSPETYEVIKTCLIWTAIFATMFAGVCTYVFLTESTSIHTQHDCHKHRMNPDEDLDHVDTALNDNVYNPN